MVGYHNCYKPFPISFYLKEISWGNYGERLFAYCNGTGGCITELSNAIGYTTVEKAIEDTERIIMMYGGSDKKGIIYNALQERGDNSLIYKPKKLNFISLKLTNIIQ